MRQKIFFDEHQARSYLQSSVIRLHKFPIYVLGVQEVDDRHADTNNKRFRIVYTNLGDAEDKILFLPNQKINMNPVPLGMMKTDDATYYVQRRPNRNWKIGLCSENIRFHLVEGRETNERKYARMPVHVNSEELRDCILGKYSSYGKALNDIIKGDRTSIPFSRNFAIERGSLVYKSIDDTVGVCEKTGPLLFDNYQYLNEILEEDMR